MIRPRRSGASFVEVAIATLFLALALIPLIDSVLSGSRRAREDRARVFAGALASSALERYRLEQAGTASGAAAGAGSDPVLNPDDAPEGWAAIRAQYQVNVTAEADGPGERIRVVVSWDESGQARKIEMVTLTSPTWGNP